MNYLKPQTPIQLEDNYIYPLTTADQVIVGNNRLNSLFKKTIQENIILLASGWSKSAPYTQTIILTESTDDYKVDANVIYSGDELDIALNRAAGCITYVKKNHKKITFYCLKNKPEIDIPIEIVGTCRNIIATVIDGVKLNFDVVAYGSEAEMLANTPLENTIGVITDTPVAGYRFNLVEPEDLKSGEVWICIDPTEFDISEGITVYPLYAKQYINGELINLVAKSYQNGKWADWTKYLYSAGGDFQDDWFTYDIGYTSGHSITFNNDMMKFTVPSGAGSGKLGRRTSAYTKVLNLSKYNTLEITVQVSNGTINQFGVANAIEGLGEVDAITYISIPVSSEFITYTVDISSVDSGHIYMRVSQGNATSNKGCVANVREIKLLV